VIVCGVVMMMMMMTEKPDEFSPGLALG